VVVDTESAVVMYECPDGYEWSDEMIILSSFIYVFYWGVKNTSYFISPQPLNKNNTRSQALVAHSCNPSYLGGWDWEDCNLRPTRTNSWWEPISRITRAKWTAGVAQAVEHLLCKHRHTQMTLNKYSLNKWLNPHPLTHT
jgi:hypothetical protein